MYRIISRDLQTWSKSKTRRPLLLRGARQVGKTWVARDFGKSFHSFVELNLEAHPEFHRPFSDFYGKPEHLISTLSLLNGKKIIPGKTLLFIDEIQACKEALLSLRYFKEKLPTLHVLAAGSLLEFTIHELSFPVGRIESIHLFPMNFKEYLLALGREDLIKEVQQAGKSINASIHEVLLSEITNYSLIGGMPEVVDAYVQEKDLSICQDLQQIIVAGFRDDFYKYSSRAGIEYLRKIFDAVPRFLGQKFKFSNVSRDIKSRELSKALSLLQDAGLVYKVHHSSANGLPLAAEKDESKFKVFSIDIGLCHRVLGLPSAQLIQEGKNLLINQGALAEQLVAQELISLTAKNESPALYYWHREAPSAQAEVDFVIALRGKTVPIEVKSGEKGTQKSLQIFLDEKKLKRGIKISKFPFSTNNGVETIPLYGVSIALS